MRLVQRVFGAMTGRRAAPARPEPRSNRARLVLESLDGRLAPSSLDPTVVSTATREASAALASAVAGPRIVVFEAEEIVGGMYVFSGKIEDANPGGLTITFGGSPVSPRGRTTVTDPDGTFSVGIMVNRDGTDIGVVSAQVTNRAGVTSELALVYIRPD